MLAVSSAGLCLSICASSSLAMSELVLCEKRILMCALGCWSLVLGSSSGYLISVTWVRTLAQLLGIHCPFRAKGQEPCYLSEMLFKLSKDVQYS